MVNPEKSVELEEKIREVCQEFEGDVDRWEIEEALKSVMRNYR